MSAPAPPNMLYQMIQKATFPTAREKQAALEMAALMTPQPAVPAVSATTAALIDMLRQRDAAGLKKYGTTLDRTDLSLQHLTEELLDGAGYAQAALRTLSVQAVMAPEVVVRNRFVSCAKGCCSKDYADGYLEALKHVEEERAKGLSSSPEVAEAEVSAWRIDPEPQQHEFNSWTYFIDIGEHGAAIECHGDTKAQARARAEAVMRSTASQPYSIDADPAGIRARVAHAIIGAMAYGAQNSNPPPSDDHWLAQFWHMARAEAEKAERPKEEVMPGNVDDNADYIEHCAGVLKRTGYPSTGSALMTIAGEYRRLASDQPREAGFNTPDEVAIEVHWLQNIGSAAALLEGTGNVMDRREAEALRKLIKSARLIPKAVSQDIDNIALDAARRCTPEGDPQGRARMQCAISDAILAQQNDDAPMIGKMVEANFSTQLVTFRMVGGYKCRAGEYRIQRAPRQDGTKAGDA